MAMARCIPEDGGYFDPKSKEKPMFNALKRALGPDFIIFHSFRLNKLIGDNGVNENEMDFLIFNPKYGCLFIEAKNRTVGYSDEKNSWVFYDTNGHEKKMEDPFTQVFTAQYNLFDKLDEDFSNIERDPVTKQIVKKESKIYTDINGKKYEYLTILNHCKKMICLWLPKYSKSELDDLYLGPTAVKDLIFTSEHLDDVELLKNDILKLMESMNKVKMVYKFEKIIDDASGYQNNLTKEEANIFISKMLAPELKTVISSQKDFNDTYVQLLEEQCAVLDFLKFQRTAAIAGCSGTGKTLVAVERARRLSDEGEKVLFLCYNRNLCDWLKNTYEKKYKNIDFYTIDSFGMKITNTYDLNKLSYYDVADVICKKFIEHSFEYKHIIVDEGQDFGKKRIDEAYSNVAVEEEKTILEFFSEYGAGDYGDEDTSFFIFYDKNQLVNSKTLPSYLNNVDSKLTLYKNCRNTKNIASTAFSVININPVMFDNAWDGDLPQFIYYNDHDELMKKLEKIIMNSSSDRKIISCAESLESSDLYHDLEYIKGQNNPKIKMGSKKTEVYTPAKCKGLEANDVILIDVRPENFEIQNKAFYVGASRAKKNLYIFIKQDSVNGIINSTRFEESFPQQDLQCQIANELHGIVR